MEVDRRRNSSVDSFERHLSIVRWAVDSTERKRIISFFLLSQIFMVRLTNREKSIWTVSYLAELCLSYKQHLFSHLRTCRFSVFLTFTHLSRDTHHLAVNLFLTRPDDSPTSSASSSLRVCVCVCLCARRSDSERKKKKERGKEKKINHS